MTLRNYDKTCLSVFIHKLRRSGFPHDLNSPADVRETVQLNTVTSVAVDSEVIYDEGDTRAIRRDIVLTLEAIIAPDSFRVFEDIYELSTNPSNDQESIITPTGGNLPNATPKVRGGNEFYNKNYDPLAMITFLEHFLSSQGLFIDLSHFPSTVSQIVSANPNYYGNTHVYGVLRDSFNGPKTLALQSKPIPGGNGFTITWKVKFSVSEQNNRLPSYFSGEDSLKPYQHPSLEAFDVSSEARLDVDKDGDLEIIVSGTVYAPNPHILYQARDALNIIINPTTGSFKETVRKEATITWDQNFEGYETEEQLRSVVNDKFAQINGFYKEVSFNVEKNGRSAKFLIRYRQVKSNSAFPIGVRDVSFTHEIRSSMLGEGFEGSGFNFWKSTYDGNIKIPHRFNANYAYFIIFHWISEKTRKLKRLTDKEVDFDGQKTLDSDPSKGRIGGIPFSMRLKHDHFKREVSFTIEWLILCPLQKVIGASCLFERLNNDYYRRLQLPKTPDGKPNQDWRPRLLSQQWVDWQRSVDPSFGITFGVVNGEGKFVKNNAANPRKHLDSSGTLMIEGGHTINPFVTNNGRTFPQFNVFITTTFDKWEKDPDYYNDDTNTGRATIDDIVMSTFLPNPVGTSLDPRAFAYQNANIDNELLAGSTNNPSFGKTTPNEQGKMEIVSERIDPRYSWIKFEEWYEVRETHPTVPVEGLSQVDSSWHGEKDLIKKYINSAPDAFENASSFQEPLGVPFPASRPGQVEHRMASGLYLNSEIQSTLPEYNPNHPEQTAPVKRQTYAVKGSRYYITVRGVAVRAQYPIAIPTVISIAGAPAIKVGDGRSMIRPSGLNGEYPVYYAAWEQTYTVDKSLLNEDIYKSIESTGSQIVYC